jgi:hypothetical protein
MVFNRFCNPSFLEIYFTFWVWNFFNFAVNTTKNWNVVCSQWEPFVLTALNYLLTGLIHSNKKFKIICIQDWSIQIKKIFSFGTDKNNSSPTQNDDGWVALNENKLKWKKKFWFSLKIWPKILKNVIFFWPSCETNQERKRISTKKGSEICHKIWVQNRKWTCKPFTDSLSLSFFFSLCRFLIQ